jgi:magnesium transporter
MDWLLSQEFLKHHPVEASRVLGDLTKDETKVFLERADMDTAATMLQHVSPVIASHCLAVWPDERAGTALEKLPLASLLRILRLMKSKEQEQVLELAPRSIVKILRSALRFPEGTAAGWTELERCFITEDLLIGQVWKHLRRQGQSFGPYVYVVDREGTLVGVASLSEVLTAQPRVPLESIMHRSVERISATDRRASVVKHPAWQKFPTLPVVDDDGILLGRIRYSTLRQLERGLESGGASDTWRHFAVSLAELYWLSSSNLVSGITVAMTTGAAPARNMEGSDDA